MHTLLFIDTNIYLDFYRIRKDVQTTLLGHITEISDHIIVTNQVEMEFKKHRQIEMINSINAIKKIDQCPIPPIVATHRSTKFYKDKLSKCNELMERMRTSMIKALKEPRRHDEIYKVTEGIWGNIGSKYNLHRGTKSKFSIRRMAFRRFIMGYPPRKSGDTSMGDAINWEWIINVCSINKCNCVIVSRDSDYGVNYNNTSIINDWLSHEFSERVSVKAKLTLTDSLSAALKLMKVKITELEEREEQVMIKRKEYRRKKRFIDSLNSKERDIVTILFGEEVQKMNLTEMADVFKDVADNPYEYLDKVFPGK